VAIINETMARRYWPGSDPDERRAAVIGQSRAQVLEAAASRLDPAAGLRCE